MQLHIKTFDELTTRELYEILRLRAEVFVVEQDCVYQDLDYVDYDSVHVFLQEGERVRACLRVYQKESEPGIWKIGRVVTDVRRGGLGAKIFPEGIRVVAQREPRATIRLEAQRQAQGFYEKFGFYTISDTFMMDGLPHVKMELKL